MKRDGDAKVCSSSSRSLLKLVHVIMNYELERRQPIKLLGARCYVAAVHEHPLKMKAHLILLLATVLCAELAHSLLCYTCPVPTASSECTDTLNCTAAFTMCKTIVYSPDVGFPFEGQPSVIKQCTKECQSTNDDEIGLKHPTYCCTTDLCNRMGVNSTATSTEISYTLLTTSVGLLSTLLQARP